MNEQPKRKKSTTVWIIITLTFCFGFFGIVLGNCARHITGDQYYFRLAMLCATVIGYFGGQLATYLIKR